MSKLSKILAACFALAMVLVSTTAFAQDGATAEATGEVLKLGGLSAGLIIIGAALGIGRIGGSAVESMARQPETAGQIQMAMIIAAALIEGATFFALIVCMLS